jgi:hypothetical protein
MLQAQFIPVPVRLPLSFGEPICNWSKILQPGSKNLISAWPYFQQVATAVAACVPVGHPPSSPQALKNKIVSSTIFGPPWRSR